MDNYVLFSDATADLPAEECRKYGLEILPMPFIVGEKSYKHYCDYRQMPAKEFYEKLKDGENVTTSQINYNQFYKAFDKVLAENKDILYLCFTSGMSGTYNTCRIAVADLKEKYPQRKIEIVDSLCASVGEGLLLYNAAAKMNELSLDEIKSWLIDNRQKACHWFVVDDLDHLKKGGRIGAAAATVGKALQIKPLLSVDEKGALVTVSKIRGAKKVYETLICKLKEDGTDTANQTVIVGNCDCKENAQVLANMLLEEKLVKDVIISDIGPIIGTHVGTGMLALAFMGERNIKS